MDYVCIALVVCNTVEGTFLVRRLRKLEFKMCLDSWFVWRLALDSVEQSQSSCVIISLGQERYAKKPITYIPLQISISYTYPFFKVPSNMFFEFFEDFNRVTVNLQIFFKFFKGSDR